MHAFPRQIAIAAFTLLISGQLAALPINSQAEAKTTAQRLNERTNSWSISFENDILAGGSQDMDYTYGLNFTYKGDAVASFPISPRRLHKAIDQALNFTPLTHKTTSESLEFGVYGFTPDEVNAANIISGDRPYASLVYLSSNRTQVAKNFQYALTTRLSIGALGLDLVGDSQNIVHKIIGSNQANGWSHQISDGGELTAKYSVALQQNWNLQTKNLELKSTYSASVGYISEASYSISFRAGNIQSSWWSFHPDLALYGEQSVPSTPKHTQLESYLWGGVSIKARVHNAFLQGQFRASEHTYAFADLNHALVEAWLGYTLSYKNGISVSYVLRGHSSEIKAGQGNRSLYWGGLVFSKSFSS